MFAELVGACGVFLAVIMALILIFASSWLFVTIADDDLTQELAAINREVKASENSLGELMRRLCDNIMAHSDARG